MRGLCLFASVALGIALVFSSPVAEADELGPIAIAAPPPRTPDVPPPPRRRAMAEAIGRFGLQVDAGARQSAWGGVDAAGGVRWRGWLDTTLDGSVVGVVRRSGEDDEAAGARLSLAAVVGPRLVLVDLTEDSVVAITPHVGYGVTWSSVLDTDGPTREELSASGRTRWRPTLGVALVADLFRLAVRVSPGAGDAALATWSFQLGMAL